MALAQSFNNFSSDVADRAPTRPASRFSMRFGESGVHRDSDDRSGDREVSFKLNARKLLPGRDAARRDIREVAAHVLQAEPAKVVARKVEATPRSVRNWTEGEHGMSSDCLIAAAQQYPEIAEYVIRAIFAGHPGGERAASVLVQLHLDAERARLEQRQAELDARQRELEARARR